VPDPAATVYDEMPYPRKAFPQSHPDRLAALARLFGVDAPDVESCRVLELGCASGDNLIPMALGLPGATFVGLDYSQRQVADGQASVDALALGNIELRHADIGDVDASWGRFDYIVAHGIYSWVPPPIRARILAICRQHLAPNGVAYLSYNTYPGWHQRGMVRDILCYHTAPIPGAAQKVGEARAFLDFLAQNIAADTPYGAALRHEAARLKGEEDGYVCHEFLESENQPFHFHEIAQAIADNGLQYLADADFSSMLPSNFPPPMAALLRQASADLVRMEQYMDIFRNRSFRQTLLVHRDASVRRAIDPTAMQRFWFAASARSASPTPSYAQGAQEMFRTPNGARLPTVNAITKAALSVLDARWPLAVPFADLAQSARALLAGIVDRGADVGAPAHDVPLLATDLLRGYAFNAVELRVRSPRLALAVSARPVASPLARLQAAQGRPITNLRHEPVALDAGDRGVLQLLDGTRDHDALVAAIKPLALDGTLQVTPGGATPADGPQLDAALRAGLDHRLPHFARAGLLVA
jgi:methyltransferase-like protein/2-polyprenyl-3-methyl-5-hydroxy-6-metoxy-1,4-benzoquinol methylase